MSQNKLGVLKSQILLGPDLLKTLPPQTKLFDNFSSSDSQLSELSAPFSDLIYTVEVESKRKAKELNGKDLYTAFSFSPEFKTTIERLKREMIKENPNYLKIDSMVADHADNFSKSHNRLYVVPTEQRENINSYEFLKFPDIDFEKESKEEEFYDKKKEKESGKDKKKKRIWDDDETLFDTMSGYWRLLSVFDEFRISPPWYDAYAEGKEHWLQTNPIPTDVLENSRKKCLNWLNKYFEK